MYSSLIYKDNNCYLKNKFRNVDHRTISMVMAFFILPVAEKEVRGEYFVKLMLALMEYAYFKPAASIPIVIILIVGHPYL